LPNSSMHRMHVWQGHETSMEITVVSQSTRHESSHQTRRMCISRSTIITYTSTTMFAGVGAHHQNGVAERRIRELQDMARTMLIHAQRRRPTAITANLWPYAIRISNDSINMTPNLKSEDHRTPLIQLDNDHHQPQALAPLRLPGVRLVKQSTTSWRYPQQVERKGQTRSISW
jgi:hypothetical protein